MKSLVYTRSYPAGNNNAGDDRYKSNVREPAFLLESNKVGKNRREKRRGGSDRLVKGDGEIPERDIATDDR